MAEIIESNRAGIFVENLICEQVEPTGIIPHKCGSHHVKRFVNVHAAKNGAAIFLLYRQMLGHIGQMIYPDDEILLDDQYLQLTTTIFFANDHYAISLSTNEGGLVFYDDLKKDCTVCIIDLSTNNNFMYLDALFLYYWQVLKSMKEYYNG